jgi:RNA polymerase sigma-70 factor (ECF subfamily)
VSAATAPSDRLRELAPEFSALYRQSLPAVYTYFYHQVGSIEDAEDLTATTFSKALANFERYQTRRGTFAAWLFGIAHNCLRDHRRSLRNAERLGPEFPDRQPLPEMQLLSAERTAAIQDAIQRLPPDQREALALRFFGGLRTGDVATVLGKSEGAIKMLMHRALATLRERSKREDWR